MTPQNPPSADPVGILDIAARLGVQANTANVWRKRGVLPEPRWTVSGSPAWDWDTDIVPWALATGRLIDHDRQTTQ